MSEFELTGMRPDGSQRRLWAIDAAIALAVTAAQLVAIYATLSWHHGAPPPGWPEYLLLGIAGLSLIARRRYPVAVLAIALAATIWAGAIGRAGLIWIALIAAFLNAVIARKRTAAVASLIIGYLASFWPLWQIGRPGHASVELALAVAAWLLVLLAGAEVVRLRRQRAAEVARSRTEQLKRQANEERMRIARDLHDVLAHNISVINVQANTALYLMDRQPQRAREALTAIHDVSRQAMAELTSVVGVLRADHDVAPRTPSPGLARLDDLIAAVSRAGLEVRLTVQGDRPDLPADVDVAGYRIAQEALTNSARHSASQAAEVLVCYQSQGVLVQVDDGGPGLGGTRDGGSGRPGRGLAGQAGNGILGMTERANALGGTLTAGARADGGFRVRAWLPLTATIPIP